MDALAVDLVEGGDLTNVELVLTMPTTSEYCYAPAAPIIDYQTTEVTITVPPTLDGVVLGDLHVVRRGRFRCTTPEGVITLRENLEDFLCDTGDREDCCAIRGQGCDLEDNSLNMNNMVVCPICWKERYGDEMPDYGVLNSMAVGAVLLNAEKIIDF